MWLGQANLQSRATLPACQGSFLAGADMDVAGCFWLSLSLSLQGVALFGPQAVGRSAQ